MNNTLTMLHTTPPLVETFDALLAELAPDVPVRRLVDESLLREAREGGGLTPALRERVAESLLGAVDEGARVVLCTCSSIGPAADFAAGLTDRPVLRVDRPMAKEAVARGSTVVVAATLPTTLEPTRDLILAAAEEAGKQISVEELLCDEAWRRLEAGDREGYLREVARQLKLGASRGDVLVLAQASMAEAMRYCADGLPVPVLTSPRLGLAAAVAAYRGEVEGKS